MDAAAPEPRPPRQAAGKRIGDAERDRAASALSDHFAAGRLDRDEFDARLTAAYGARKAADLEPLFRDLPEPSSQPRTVDRPGSRAQRPLRFFAVPLLPVLLLVAVVTTVATRVPFPFFIFPLLWFAGGFRRRRGW